MGPEQISTYPIEVDAVPPGTPKQKFWMLLSLRLYERRLIRVIKGTNKEGTFR